MKKLLGIFLISLVAGCGGNPFKAESNAAIVTPEADKQVVKLDPRLLEKCPVIDDSLPSGAEEDVVAWSKKILSKAKSCREDQHKAAEFLQNTFKERGNETNK